MKAWLEHLALQHELCCRGADCKGKAMPPPLALARVSRSILHHLAEQTPAPPTAATTSPLPHGRAARGWERAVKLGPGIAGSGNRPYRAHFPPTIHKDVLSAGQHLSDAFAQVNPLKKVPALKVGTSS